jgi:apolipoprotein D and lipocalin family protein
MEAKHRKSKVCGRECSHAKSVILWAFYGDNVVAIDKEYKYALVAGGNYLWILSREKSIPLEVTSDYLKIAEDIGYKTADLIWVQHTK